MRNKIYLLCLHVCMLFSLGASTTVTYADEPFIGEVRWFAGNFAPRNWALCDGQLLAINQNQALFSLLGTNYGGDGRTTFGLPEMRGRGMVHHGTGSGLTNRRLGQKAGAESETLNNTQLPSHAHTLRADSSGGDSVLPEDRVVSKVGRLRIFADTPDSDMGAASITGAGGNQPHNNMQPYTSLNCIIALQGLYPPRN
jgi:microcystin-dependent protein